LKVREIEKWITKMKLPAKISTWFAEIGLTDFDELAELTDKQVVDLMSLVPDVKKPKFKVALEKHRPVVPSAFTLNFILLFIP